MKSVEKIIQGYNPCVPDTFETVVFPGDLVAGASLLKWFQLL